MSIRLLNLCVPEEFFRDYFSQLYFGGDSYFKIRYVLAGGPSPLFVQGPKTNKCVNDT